MSDDLARVQRRLDRERAARREAEAIAERSIAALHQRQRQLELLEAVAVAANQAESMEDALRETLAAVCSHLEYPLGHALVVSAPGRLSSTGLWHSDALDRYEEFRRVTERTEFETGVGLPGRVLETGRPQISANVREDPSFFRVGSRSALPIAGALAFPVLVGDETVAVVELFSDATIDLDEAMLHLVGQIGTQLGRVVERDRARQDMTHHALHDALTGLPNRTLLLDRVHSALARVAAAARGSRCCSWTSIGSRRSTTPTATTPATPC